MSQYNIIASTTESTVVAEYTPGTRRSDGYQSEAQLEKEFIRLLCEVGYTYLPIHTEADLVANLRTQLEKLNNYQFTDGEWERFFQQSIANANEGIKEKTRRMPHQRSHPSQSPRAAPPGWLSGRGHRCKGFPSGMPASRRTFGCWIRNASTTTRCRSSTNIPSLRRRARRTTTATM